MGSTGQITALTEFQSGFYMQSDSIPFCVFTEKLGEVQENVFTAVTEHFSRYLIHLGEVAPADGTLPEIVDVKRMLVERGFRTDSAFNLVVGIDPREVMPRHTSPAFVREACERLAMVQVQFKIDRWYDMKNVRARQSLFIGVLSPESLEGADGAKVYVSLNNWAIPYFLFYGAYDIYFGKVQKDIALSLRGQTAKRLYKMICSMYGKKGNRCELPLDELRGMLNLNGEMRRMDVPREDGMEYYVTGKKTYRRADKMRGVLDQARDLIKASGSDYWFEYELLSRNHNGKRGRQPMDTVVFTVHNRGELPGERGPIDESLFGDLADLFRLFANYDIVPVMSVQETAERILRAGAAETVLRKHAFYRKRIQEDDPYDPLAREDRKKRLRHEFNIIHKILKQDYGIILNTGTGSSRSLSGRPSCGSGKESRKAPAKIPTRQQSTQS